MKVTSNSKKLTLTSDEASQIAKIVNFFNFDKEFNEYNDSDVLEIINTIARMDNDIESYSYLDNLDGPLLEIQITDEEDY